MGLVVGLAWLASFNGQWRITPDSALYRSLGRSVASGEGMRYMGVVQDRVYPGLPYVLGGMRRWLGEDLRPMLLLNAALAGLSLWLIYQTVALRHPRWVAAAVAGLCGLNRHFLLYTHSLLTDLPFLTCTCLLLYGVARARTAGDRRAWWVGVVAAVAGLAGGWAMRPTIWVLVVGAIAALLMVRVQCLVRRAAGRLRNKRGNPDGVGSSVDPSAERAVRRWGGWKLGLPVAGLGLVAVGLAVAWATGWGGGGGVDPAGWLRHDGRRFIWLLQRPAILGQRLAQHGPELLGAELGSLLFWWHAGWVGGVVVLVSGLGVGRKFRWWAALTAVLLGVALLKGSEVRYWLMLLPVVALGYVQGLRRLAWCCESRRRRGRRAGAGRRIGRWVVGLGLAAVWVPQGLGVLHLTATQRVVPFEQRSGDGRWWGLRPIAEALSWLPAEARVLAPEGAGRVLTYWSGRAVSGAWRRTLPPGHGLSPAAATAVAGVGYAVIFDGVPPFPPKLRGYVTGVEAWLADSDVPYGPRLGGEGRAAGAGGGGGGGGGRWLLVRLKHDGSRADASRFEIAETLAGGPWQPGGR